MRHLFGFYGLFLVISSPVAFGAESKPAKPNIILILVDDMPWFGTPVRMDPDLPASAMAFRNMPNVQRLVEGGMVFRNARAAAGMCAPSRCSIQTGMMTARHLYSGNGGFGPKTDGTVEYLRTISGRRTTLPRPIPKKPSRCTNK